MIGGVPDPRWGRSGLCEASDIRIVWRRIQDMGMGTFENNSLVTTLGMKQARPAKPQASYTRRKKNIAL